MIRYRLVPDSADLARIRQQPERFRAAARAALGLALADGRNHVEDAGFSGGPAHLTSRHGIHGLLGSVVTKITDYASGVLGEMGSPLVYARIHELGGIIRARFAPRLVFRIPGVGWRSAQSVNMPARPYLRPAMAYGLKQLGERHFGDMLRREGLS